MILGVWCLNVTLLNYLSSWHCVLQSDTWYYLIMSNTIITTSRRPSRRYNYKCFEQLHILCIQSTSKKEECWQRTGWSTPFSVSISPASRILWNSSQPLTIFPGLKAATCCNDEMTWVIVNMIVRITVRYCEVLARGSYHCCTANNWTPQAPRVSVGEWLSLIRYVSLLLQCSVG